MEIRLRAFETLDSTNSELKKLAAEGAPEGTVVIANEQTAGRGRLGRSFASAPGAGIYMSVLLRPCLDLDCAPSLTAVTAVAVSRAIEKCCGRAVGIKWTNDLYLRNKKICGILCESSLRADKLDYAVVGIGVNVTTRTEDFPPEIRDVAGSLYTQTGYTFERGAIISAILAELDEVYRQWLEGPSRCLEEYRQRCFILGSEVTVSAPDGEYRATAESISPDYGLRVRLDSGEIRTLHCGEVSLKM